MISLSLLLRCSEEGNINVWWE